MFSQNQHVHAFPHVMNQIYLHLPSAGQLCWPSPRLVLDPSIKTKARDPDFISLKLGLGQYRISTSPNYCGYIIYVISKRSLKVMSKISKRHWPRITQTCFYPWILAVFPNDFHPVAPSPHCPPYEPHHPAPSLHATWPKNLALALGALKKKSPCRNYILFPLSQEDSMDSLEVNLHHKEKWNLTHRNEVRELHMPLQHPPWKKWMILEMLSNPNFVKAKCSDMCSLFYTRAT